MSSKSALLNDGAGPHAGHMAHQSAQAFQNDPSDMHVRNSGPSIAMEDLSVMVALMLRTAVLQALSKDRANKDDMSLSCQKCSQLLHWRTVHAKHAGCAKQIQTAASLTENMA